MDEPSIRCRANDRAMKPERFISSTKSRRYFAPASRPRGVPIAWLIDMNLPGSMRKPGILRAAPSSCGLTPAMQSSSPWVHSHETDIPRLGCELGDDLAGGIVRYEVDRYAQAARQLAREIGRNSGRR